MPILGLLALFIVVPLAELYLIFEVVGDGLGWLPTLALLVAASLLGTALLRSQGRSVWRQFQRTLAEGRMPHREVVEGALVIFGGAFLITPGFITDVVGLLLLLPPTRAVARRAVMRRLTLRMRTPPRAGGDVVDGTATESNGTTRAIER
jgi:UPF0716 protein FxsA